MIYYSFAWQFTFRFHFQNTHVSHILGRTAIMACVDMRWDGDRVFKVPCDRNPDGPFIVNFNPASESMSFACINPFSDPKLQPDLVIKRADISSYTAHGAWPYRSGWKSTMTTIETTLSTINEKNRIRVSRSYSCQCRNISFDNMKKGFISYYMYLCNVHFPDQLTPFLTGSQT